MGREPIFPASWRRRRRREEEERLYLRLNPNHVRANS